MDIVITQWALNTYLDLVLNKQIITKNEFLCEIKPDVLKLKNYPNEPWSIARSQKGTQPITDGYKMKWRQVGAGKVQIRLTVGMFPIETLVKISKVLPQESSQIVEEFLVLFYEK